MDYCDICLQQYDEGLCGCDIAKQIAESIKTQDEREEDDRRRESESNRD